MTGTLFVAGLASLLGGLFLVQTGRRLWSRAGSAGAEEPRDALRAFGLWWVAIGLNTWANIGLLAAGDAGDLHAAMAVRSLTMVLIGIATWGLLTYVAFVRTGSKRMQRPIAVAYAILVAVTIVHIWTASQDLVVGRWSVDIEPQPSPLSTTAALVLTLAFLLPPVIAAASFLPLARRAGAEQARRIRAVGFGIPAWFLLHILARFVHADAWQVVTRVVLGVLVAFWIWRAYDMGPRLRPFGEGLHARVAELV